MSSRRPTKIALKVMRKTSQNSARHEMAVHHAIDESHPGRRYIVRLLEGFLVDEYPVLAFEVFGRELGSLLEKDGPLSVDQFKILGRQMLLALDALHQTGFAHGDLKPGNILWDAKQNEARLIDLGWSRRHYHLGQGIATRSYCPPEMLLGLKMTPAVDLWSLGCTLFEVLTGEELFDPHAACESKYKEFTSSYSAESVPEAEGEDAKKKEEEPPPLKLDAGMLLAERFRLKSVLGDGKNGDVWLAEMVRHGSPKVEALKPAIHRDDRADKIGSGKRPAKLDVWEVVLGYEHFLEMQAYFGTFPSELAKQGMFHYILFNDDGTLRFQPEIKPVTLTERLMKTGKFDLATAQSIDRLLRPMFEFDPAARPSARAVLETFS
ncbi:MAG TPA: protein kinase [Candidatus Saccharimonadia bacterium]|nr:protein kinase [Candidatus Saccharimonadia bacterium]